MSYTTLPGTSSVKTITAELEIFSLKNLVSVYGCESVPVLIQDDILNTSISTDSNGI